MPAAFEATLFPVLFCRRCGGPTQHRYEGAEDKRSPVTQQVDHQFLVYSCCRPGEAIGQPCGTRRVWGMVEGGAPTSPLHH